MSSDIINHEQIVTTSELCGTNEQIISKGIEAEDECNTMVCGTCATAIGCGTKAFGDCSTAEGAGTKAYGSNSHSEGNNTVANGDNSHAEGCTTVAYGNCSHTEGANTNTYADYSHAEGYNTKTRGIRSHAEGISTESNAEGSHAQGASTRAEGYASFADGYNTVARGSYSHAEGYLTTAANTFAHSEGYNTQANGYASHTEGANSIAKLDYSHAEGYNTSSNYYYSHTEGYLSKADGYAAHAEGYNSSAAGSYSHAEGYNAIANASYSHAEGYNTNTRDAVGSNIMGIYGDADTPYSWFLGGGTSDKDRALAAKILYTGYAYIKNAWNAGGTGYAEMFRSACQTIDAGYFVTLRGDNIQLADCGDEYILGVTTATPGFVANSMVLKNNTSSLSTARLGYEVASDMVLPEVKDHEGKVLASEQVIKVPVPSVGNENMKDTVQYSDSDTNWTAVALLGQVVVFDDGTCKPNHYCRPNEDGIATEAQEGYRVMKRLCENQVLILLR